MALDLKLSFDGFLAIAIGILLFILISSVAFQAHRHIEPIFVNGEVVIEKLTGRQVVVIAHSCGALQCSYWITDVKRRGPRAFVPEIELDKCGRWDEKTQAYGTCL